MSFTRLAFSALAVAAATAYLLRNDSRLPEVSATQPVGSARVEPAPRVAAMIAGTTPSIEAAVDRSSPIAAKNPRSSRAERVRLERDARRSLRRVFGAHWRPPALEDLARGDKAEAPGAADDVHSDATASITPTNAQASSATLIVALQQALATYHAGAARDAAGRALDPASSDARRTTP